MTNYIIPILYILGGVNAAAYYHARSFIHDIDCKHPYCRAWSLSSFHFAFHVIVWPYLAIAILVELLRFAWKERND